jgi:WD40 repeat protein
MLLLSALVGAVVLVVAYIFFTHFATKSTTTAAPVPTQQVKHTTTNKHTHRNNKKKVLHASANATPKPACLLAELVERRAQINSLSWHPSERALALALSDRKLKLWLFGDAKQSSTSSSSGKQKPMAARRAFESRRQQEVQVPFDVANTVDFTPDGKFLVCSLESKKEIGVFRFRTEKTR